MATPSMPKTSSRASLVRGVLASEDFGVGRARRQLDGVAVAAAAAAGVALRGAGHVLDVEQRRAVDGGAAPGLAVPGGAVDAEVHRRDAREQGEDAGDRAEVAAPDALALAVEPADGDGGDRRAAEDEQRRLRVFVDADELAVERGEDEGEEGPAAPAQPFRDGVAAAVARGELGQRALRAEHAAPDAAHEHDGEDDEGPPDAPEEILGEQHQALVPLRRVGGLVLRRQRRAVGGAGFAVHEGGRAEVAGEQPRLRVRMRQEGGQHDEEGVEENDRPLHAEDQAAVRRHPVAEARQPRLAAGVEDEGRRGVHFAIDLQLAGDRIELVDEVVLAGLQLRQHDEGAGAGGLSTFSMCISSFSNSSGPGPSLMSTSLTRCPAGTSMRAGLKTPSRTTISKAGSSPAATALPPGSVPDHARNRSARRRRMLRSRAWRAGRRP
jgi:hypothetical protein